MTRAFNWLNGGEDHLYTQKIAREAKAHGAQLIFVHLPMFEGPQTVSDLNFLKQFGAVLNFGDLAPHDELFENWSHLNHAGAMTASARLAAAIAGLDL
jgi:prephenate dehydrogenase